MENPKTLEDLRDTIDEIDKQIIELAAKRISVSKHAQCVKRELGLPVLSLARESEVIKLYSILGHDGIDIATSLLRLSRGLNGPKKT